MNTWIAFKSAIAEKVEWFNGFDKSFSELLNDAIKKNQIEKYDYDSLLIESLLKDISSLLDKCLVYRRDAQELEILATRAAADYSKFLDLLPIQREAETLGQGLDRLAVERLSASKAAEAFGGDTSHSAIEKGFEAVEVGKVAALDKQIATSIRQVALINERWDITQRYEEQAQARHTAKGNSHNYKDRMDRLLRFLAEDFQESYAKAYALFDGIEAVYGRKFLLPEISMDSAIDDVVHVIRNAARFLEQESQRFTFYDAIIPLCQPFISTRGSAQPIVDYNAFRSSIDNGGWLEIDMSPVFETVRSPRLRGVGLSFGNELSKGLDPGQLPEMSAYRISAQMILPEQLIRGVALNRPHINFGNVSVFGGSTAVAWNSSNSCYNASPIGKWQVRLDLRAVHSLRVEKFAKSLVEDLKIHMSISALI